MRGRVVVSIVAFAASAAAAQTGHSVTIAPPGELALGVSVSMQFELAR